MKKILLSAAVIALSGAYVAYEDHGASAMPSLDAALAAAPAKAAVAPAAVNPAVPAPTVDAAPAPAVPPPAPTSAAIAAPKPVAQMASEAPGSVSPTDADTIGSIIADNSSAAVPEAIADAPQPAADTSQPAVVMPLPLPRPADAPQAGVVALSDSSQAGLPIQSVAAAQDVAQAQDAFRNGTYKGVSANAYYGRVQVEAIVSNGHLASIRMLDYPSDRRRSLYIARQSLPILEQEAIAAQSANIDTVSGATLTSEAFIKSLDSALAKAQAGGGNA